MMGSFLHVPPASNMASFWVSSNVRFLWMDSWTMDVHLVFANLFFRVSFLDQLMRCQLEEQNQFQIVQEISNGRTHWLWTPKKPE